MFFDRQEDQPYPVFAGQRQREAKPRAGVLEEGVRDLYQDPGPVSGDGIASAGPPVGQIDENLDPLLDDVVRFFAADARDEADAAGIPLKTRVVQTLAGRVPAAFAPLFHQSHTFPRGGTFHVARPVPE